MRRIFTLSVTLVTAVALLVSLHAQQQIPKEPDLGHGLPGLKQSQIEDLLKDDKKKSVKDAQEIIERAQALKDELESNDQHVISLKAMKQTEEIEKLAKRIRGRMRRF